MAEKISTLIISVDLDCSFCNKKIRKTLRKFPEIQKQTFDTKQNTVTVSGHFDPEKLSKCIRCRAGKSIKDIHIVKDPPPKPKQQDPPKPKQQDPPKQPDPPKPDPPKADPPRPALPIAYPPPYYCYPLYEAGPCSSRWPYYPVRPSPPRVCCRHCYEGNCGGSCTCRSSRPCPPRVCYEGNGGGSCTCSSSRPCSCGFFSEEDQSCRTM